MERYKLSQMAPITAGSAILEAALEGKNVYIVGNNDTGKTMMLHAVVRGLPNEKTLRIVEGYSEHPFRGEYPMRNVVCFNIIMEMNNAGMDGSVLVADNVDTKNAQVMIDNYPFNQQITVMHEENFNEIKDNIKMESIIIKMKDKGCKIPTVEKVTRLVSDNGKVKSEVIYK